MVVVGGVAMVIHAYDGFTYDVDICFERTPQNAERLCRALAPHCQPIRSAFWFSCFGRDGIIKKKFSAANWREFSRKV
jgi:hypothetical protein